MNIAFSKKTKDGMVDGAIALVVAMVIFFCFTYEVVLNTSEGRRITQLDSLVLK